VETVKHFINTYLKKTELSISKICEVKSKKDFIYYDKLEDGTWRMVYSKGSITE